MNTREPEAKTRPRWLWVVMFLGVILIILMALVVDVRNPHELRTSRYMLVSYGCNPKWSPDGQSIGFYGSNGSGVKVWLVRLDAASNPGKLEDGTGPDFSWGADRRGPGATLELGSLIRDAKGVTLVSGESSSPGSWGHSSQGPIHEDIIRISFHAEDAGKAVVARVDGRWVVAVNDDAPNIVTEFVPSLAFPADRESRPAWSPDGRYVAWAVGREIVVYDRVEAKPARYPIPEGYAGFYIQWHPSEARFLYPIWSADPAKAAMGKGGLRSLDPSRYKGFAVQDLGGVRRVYASRPKHECFSPVWHPAGRYVTYVTGDDRIVLADLSAAHGPIEKTLEATGRYAAQWNRAGRDPYCWLSWDPQGTSLAFGRGNGGVVIYECPAGTDLEKLMLGSPKH